MKSSVPQSPSPTPAPSSSSGINAGAEERIENALVEIRRGGLVVVADHPDRENEGDLIMAAEKATPEKIAFIVRHTSGIICVGMQAQRLSDLRLPQMVTHDSNDEALGTAFTISVDLRQGTTTGISAADRAATIRALADQRDAGPGRGNAASAEDFRRPGHVFPLRAHRHGVLARPGHTEAAVDLARLAGLAPAGALCEIVNDDGTMARGVQLREFAEKHNLPYITIPELIAYRRRTERLVTCTGQAKLPTRHGHFAVHAYRSEVDGVEHLALVKGDVRGQKNVLVRVHSECSTGDILGSLRCDCGNQLALALERIEEEGAGVLVYLKGHEGRGIGMTHKIRAYALQDTGRDTVQANIDLGLPVDGRTYDVGAQILSDLGLTTIRIMSNNPRKVTGLGSYNLEIVERVPLMSTPTHENLGYLQAKERKLGHILHCL